MIKRILITAVLSIMIFQSVAFAVETEGEVVFKDGLYGAAIGFILGTAIYFADDREDFAGKAGVGVAVGTVAGLIYGITETRSFAEINKDEIKIAIPTPVIQKRDNEILYSVYLFKTKF